jgi:hypothetical protein
MPRNRTHKVSVFVRMEVGELCDLEADPDEFDNLWASRAHHDLKMDMIKLCFDASVLIQDPLPERTADW